MDKGIVHEFGDGVICGGMYQIKRGRELFWAVDLKVCIVLNKKTAPVTGAVFLSSSI